MHEFENLADGEMPMNIPLGKPIPGVRMVIKTEDGASLDGTGTGELLVRTPFQTRGYLNAALNEDRFSRHIRMTEGARRPTTARATSSAATTTAC